jgi:AcrR family transcriptional regulator
MATQRRSGPVDPQVLAERRRRRRQRLVNRLLVVVESLLAQETSYLELTVERILEADGLARSTFYSYFDDKADLIAALAETAMQEILAGAQAIWELPPDATRAQVAQAVGHTIEAYLPHTLLMDAVVEVSTYDAGVGERFRAGYSAAAKAAARHIRAGQAAGYVRLDLHPDETAAWLTWMAERGMTQLVQGAGRARLNRLQDTFTSILWYTLYDGQGRPAS